MAGRDRGQQHPKQHTPASDTARSGESAVARRGDFEPLRQSRFAALREDKATREVVREDLVF